MKNVLTTQQIAHVVGFSVVAIRHWFKWGLIPGAYKKGGRWQVPYPEKGLRIDSMFEPRSLTRSGWTRIAKKERVQLAQLLSEQGIPFVALACRVGRKTVELYRPIDWQALP